MTKSLLGLNHIYNSVLSWKASSGAEETPYVSSKLKDNISDETNFKIMSTPATVSFSRRYTDADIWHLQK